MEGSRPGQILHRCKSRSVSDHHDIDCQTLSCEQSGGLDQEILALVVVEASDRDYAKWPAQPLAAKCLSVADLDGLPFGFDFSSVVRGAEGRDEPGRVDGLRVDEDGPGEDPVEKPSL